MTPLFQKFEISHPDGHLFFDRSGALTHRLRDHFPSLATKDETLLQRDFSISSDQVDLYFGARLSGMQTFSALVDFPQKAATFVSALTEVFEISQIGGFSFRHVMGKACSTPEEANNLMWPFVSAEQKARMEETAPLPLWRSFQGEFSQGPLIFETKVAILDLLPTGDDLSNHSPEITLPHITFHLEARGMQPIGVADFDVAAFIDNFRKNHSTEILGKLAPQLASL